MTQLLSISPKPIRGLPYRALIKLAVPLLIVLGAIYVGTEQPTYWQQFQGLALAFIGAVYGAVLFGGHLRNIMAVLASLLFCLAAFEVYSIKTYVRTTDIHTPGYSVERQTLGWGPGHPGVFHHKKLDSTGRVLLDVDYTIDAHLHRRVLSAENGPTVVFFGGSTTFGSGISDFDTLPQQFAELTGRRLHIVNLGFSGYGPQQLLRGLETGLFDEVVKQPRSFVIQAQPEYIERSSCVIAHMAHAPRYELVDGRPVFQGSCREKWSLPIRTLFAVSSLYRVLVEPRLQGAQPAKVDLYVAVLARAGEIIREKYGIPTTILYLPDPAYLRSSGYTDQQLMQRLRDRGLMVIDGRLDQNDFPGQPLTIPGDGHPTIVANRAWAAMVRDAFEMSSTTSK